MMIISDVIYFTHLISKTIQVAAHKHTYYV